MSLLKVQGNISGTGSVTLASPDTSNNITLVLPSTVGTADQALVTDGSGNLSFTTINSARSGGTTTSSATDITLTSSSTQTQLVTMTATGKNVILPDATTLAKGEGAYEITAATGSYAFNIKNGAGDILYGPVFPGVTVQLSLVANTSSAGTWTANGVIARGGYSAITTSSVSGFSVNNIKVVGLSATSAIIFYQSAINTLSAVGVSISGTTATFGTPVTISTSASRGSNMSAVALSSTLAVVSFVGSTAVFNCCAVSISGTTLTAGAVTTVVSGVTNIFSGQVIYLAANTGLLTYNYDDGTNCYSVVRALSVSGTTITLGSATTNNTIATGTTAYSKTALTSSNSFVTVYADATVATPRARAFTFSGTTLTAGTAVNMGQGNSVADTSSASGVTSWYWAWGSNNNTVNPGLYTCYSPATNYAIFFNTLAGTSALIINTSGTTVSSYSGTQLSDQSVANFMTYAMPFGSSGECLAMNVQTTDYGPLYIISAGSTGIKGVSKPFPYNSMMIGHYCALDSQSFLLAGITTSGANSYLTTQILKVLSP